MISVRLRRSVAEWGRFGRVTDPRAVRRPWLLLFVAIALVAVNMRMTITGVGALLDQIAADQGVPTAALGALGSIPLLAWAAFSPTAHWLSARVGLSNAVSISLVVMAAGTVWRSVPGSPLNLWLGTALIGMGLAISNVLMPAVIKRDFPGRLALVMGVYTALLSGMGAVVTGIVVPLSHVSAGDGELGWRIALLLTGAPLPLALLVWIWAHGIRRDPTGSDPATPAYVGNRSAGRRIWGDRLAWMVSLYMGVQSVLFYTLLIWFVPYQTSLGRSPVAAGIEFMIFQLFGVVGSMLVPLLSRGRLRRWLPAAVPLIGLVAWIGLLVAPAANAVWIVTGGAATGALLVIALMLTAQRARTQSHATALSGMAQSLGYTIAAVGPIVFGWLYGLTGTWLPSFALMWAIGILLALLGLPVGRPRYVLDRPQAERA